jgi:16S rRNA (adenine1518-N6/adenine1519-N6)-dimethyltransferase
VTRVVPKKAFGQHFLADDNILRVIERLADLDSSDVVLEIGPGLGVLTDFLAPRVAHVHAVEIDRTLETALSDRVGSLGNVTLHWGDALRLDLARLEPFPTKLVANLPYNVATPIVVESLSLIPSLDSWCVMVQREVADRFFARPSTKDYNSVSVLVQLCARRTGLHPVSRHVFRPPPNVESALVAFQRVPIPDRYAEIRRLVVAAFGHRRKTLANALQLGGVTDRDMAAAALVSLGLEPNARAEALEPAAFIRLEHALREPAGAGAGRSEQSTI